MGLTPLRLSIRLGSCQFIVAVSMLIAVITCPWMASPFAVRAEDCDQDGLDDLEEIRRGEARDCNRNGIPDRCELAGDYRIEISTSTPFERLRIHDFELGDFDGDGDPDVLVAFSSSCCKTGSRGIVLWNDAGRLVPGPMTERGPNAFTSGDFDGDGLADLVVGGEGLELRLNLGEAFFGEPAQLDSGFDFDDLVLAADVDADGDPDLVVRKLSLSLAFPRGRTSVLLIRNSAGRLEEHSTLDLPPPATLSAVADLDGDRDLDLVLTDDASGTVQVRWNEGDFTFSGALPVAEGIRHERFLGLVPAADTDGDGLVDIILAESTDRRLWILRHRGAPGERERSFGPPLGIDLPVASLEQFVPADLNADGHVDLLVRGPSLRVLWGRADGGYEIGDPLEVASGASMAILDVDADGDLDILGTEALEPDFHTPVLWRNTGDGGLQPRERLALTGPPSFSAAAVGGHLLGLPASGGILNAGSSSSLDYFRLRSDLGIGVPVDATVVDLDGNLGLDSIAVFGVANELVVFLHMPAFRDPLRTPLGSRPSAVAAGDFDGDGLADVVVGLPDRRELALFRGLGDGRLERGPSRGAGAVEALLAVDLDGNGVVDALAADPTRGVITFVSGPGFLPVWGVEDRPGISALASGDIDGDGRVDLAVANRVDETVSLYRQEREGFFELVFRRPSGVDPASLTIRDLDRDGFPELAVANRGSDSLTCFRNRRGVLESGREFPAGSSPLIIEEPRPRSILIVLSRGEGPMNQRDSMPLRDLGSEGPDCDEDGILNECEIASGNPDLNADGIPDECQVARDFCQGPDCAPDDLYFCFPDDLGPTLRTGLEFDAFLMIDAVSEGIQGWALGVAHDPARLELIEATSEGLGLSPPFFETTGPAAGEPPPGFVTARVLRIFPEGETLPIGDGQALVRARYRVLDEISAARPTSLTFSDELLVGPGHPPTTTALTIGQRTRRPRRLFEAELGSAALPFCSKEHVPRFSRGDGNGDGSLDISDAVAVLRRLFIGKGTAVDCDDALDVNDDGRLDTTDPVVLVFWMFGGASRPSFPFLDCGADPTGDDLGCVVSNCGVSAR